MRKLNVNDIFSGYNDIHIPSEVNRNIPLTLTLSVAEAQENALLFITEKIGTGSRVTDMNKVKSKLFAIVASEQEHIIANQCPIIRVGNVRSALAYALSNIYSIDFDKIKFVGITGTNGKTTTATLIYEILKRSGYKVGFVGTGKIISDKTTLSDENYSMTTPDPTVLYPAIAKMSADGCQYIVMEISSHSLALGKVDPIKFTYSIFTNLDNDHLDFHKTKEEYFKAKLKLFSSSERALFNLDDNYSRKAFNMLNCEKASFGVIHQGDAYATEIAMDLEKTTFYYREKNMISKVSTQLTGAFNVYNSIAALKCTIDLGIKPCIAKRALEQVAYIDGRMEIIKDSITVIIDYAHTPDAFYNSIKTLKQNINSKQKLTIVFGCGGDRDRIKRPLFGKHAEKYADKIIITEDNSRSEDFECIKDDITSEMIGCKHEVIENRQDAIRSAILSASPGDVVAVIGKGHEKYQISKNGYIPFDEKEIIKNALSELRSSYENKA